MSSFSKVDAILARHHYAPGALISILQETQEEYGYVPPEVLNHIAKKTRLRPAHVYGVATFYTQFRLEPLGKQIITVCQGTACHVNGSEMILAAIAEELGLQPGETTPDGQFTLETVACLGCCGLAPVMMIDGTAYGQLTPDKTRRVLNDLKTKAAQTKKKA
ncbi:MAG: NADH-quinone oxidoreductase subunit NuoE [Firmicutes bacterium]|jgi:NADH-quinone oxidoreductase subunit E|nr:NADH-quinone oxidoreductase subunit NuoE [Bacillota bacterium]